MGQGEANAAEPAEAVAMAIWRAEQSTAAQDGCRPLPEWHEKPLVWRSAIVEQVRDRLEELDGNEGTISIEWFGNPYDVEVQA